MLDTNWRSVATFVAGWWLVLSTWVLNYYDYPYAAWSAAIVGIALMISEMAAFIRSGVWKELFHVMLGGYLIAAPFVLGFSGNLAPAVNAMAMGVVIIALALGDLSDDPEARRWWHDHIHHVG